MDDSYTKGKNSGKRTIGETIGEVTDNIKTREDLEKFLSYMWGTRDAYSEILTEYMPRMIPIQMPEDMSQTEMTMLWEIASTVMVYYDSILQQNEHIQELVNDSVARIISVVLEMAQNKLPADIYRGLLHSMQDMIDEKISEGHKDNNSTSGNSGD